MTTSIERPAANWMDRLSDWIGSLVPGCSRLPARHPLKVSLVMGWLGLISGWATMGLIFVIQAIWIIDTENYYHPIPGSFLGIVMFVPLLKWQGRSNARCVIVCLLSVAAGALHVALLNEMTQGGPAGDKFSLVGGFAGIGYAVVGMAASSPRQWWLIIPVSLFSALNHGCFCLAIKSQKISLPMPVWLETVASLVIAMNLFAWVFAVVGIAFSSGLWDRTPPPKFEPLEERDAADPS